MVAVDIQAGPQSHPATEGGWKGICPIRSQIQAQSPVSTPRPVVRSIPATRTIGALTIRGWPRSA
jgi:hypothetical protein